MKKLRIYIDTSVIGGCFDEEFVHWSKQLIAEINKGLKVAVISDLTRQELDMAPERVKQVLFSLNNVEDVTLSQEAEDLAKLYVQHGAVTQKHIVDAQHIAIATVERIDALVSWNFKQIVNLDKIHLFNSLNLKFGYPVLEIRSPREVIDEKDI